MAIKTILAGLSGGAASNGTGELACRVAAGFGACLTGLHVRADVSEVVMSAGAEGLPAATTMRWSEEISGAVATRAGRTKAAFAAATARHGLPFTDAPPPLDVSIGPLLTSR